jgi:two-component system phosphate regulon sensor histidine kinase PhoR
MTDDRPTPPSFRSPKREDEDGVDRPTLETLENAETPLLPGSTDGITRATLILTLPAALVLLVFGFVGHLPISFVFGGIGVILVATYLLVRRHLTGLERLRHHLEERANSADIDRVIDTRAQALEPIGSVGSAAALASSLDKSDRRMAEHMAILDQISATRAAVIDSIPDPLLQIDARLRVSTANLAARKQFGQHILDRDLSAVIRHPDVLSAVKGALADGGSGEIEIEIAAPIERVFNVRMQALPDRADHLPSVLMLFVDLSSVRRSEQMRVDFVANVSHELRTPLATLVGFIETLQGPAREDLEAHDKFLGIMRGQASRMTRLVNDLLSLSRIEINEHTPPTDHTAFGPLLNSVKATLDLEAKRKDMRVRVEIEPDLPAVFGDEDELAQVIQNLMDNAIKYGRAGTEVTVVAKRADRVPASYPARRDQAIVLSVRDRGDGIHAEHIPRLTERFYRVDTARSRELGGTGLGLAIVKHIISRHRGTLTVESKVGDGSTISVYLPQATGTAETPSWPSTRPGAASSAATSVSETADDGQMSVRNPG